MNLDRDHDPDRLTPSICEEALERFSQSDDSLAGVIESNNIEVRDFMDLSFVCDQRKLSSEQLVRAVGLSRESVRDCIERLSHAGLVRDQQVPSMLEPRTSILPTPAGRIITRRILERKSSFPLRPFRISFRPRYRFP